MSLVTSLFPKNTIIYDDFSLLVDVPLREQLSELKEDMLQVRFGSNILLDLGWYPSFDKSGKFQVRVIQELNWDEPLIFVETAELKPLIHELRCLAQLCAELSVNQ